ncbi:MAG: UvrD-helicase domain-containing protein [Planctomycetota bacterium]
MNIQHRNTGNMGDILKHAGLLKLFIEMRARYPATPLNYLDTHTFQLEADCANEEWNAQIEGLAKDFPGYRTYQQMEAPRVQQGRYWCSCRLALEVLGKDTNATRLFLAEGDAETRRELRRQLADLDLSPAHLQNNMLEFTQAQTLGAPGPLVALIDPFLKTETDWEPIWNAALRAIELLRAPDADGAIMIYQYRKAGESPFWPNPPAGFIGPIATIARPANKTGEQHCLAVYATPALEVLLSPEFTALNWKTAHPTSSIPTEVPASAPSAAVTRRLFDRYIMADYSGAADEKVQREKIVVIELDNQPGSKPAKRNFTRAELCDYFVTRLAECRKNNERVLFGIDHQFGWPLRILEAAKLLGLNWRAALQALKTGSYGGIGPRLEHPNVFCNAFNTFLQAHKEEPCYFSKTQLYGLPKKSNFNGGWPPFRLTEEVLIRQGYAPKPATEIGSNGAVGGQTICGLLELANLIEGLKRCETNVTFWPFDGLQVDASEYSNNHVGVEIYPSLVRPDDVEQTDENDALYSAIWFKDQDAKGLLSQVLNLSRLASDESRIRKEGWVAACVPAAAEEGGRDAPPIRSVPVALTEEQQAVLNETAPLVRVVARAGTGKTTTMVALAVKNLSENPGAHVLMLTFTRNAADSMRERFVERDGDATRFRSGTYHGFALRCLLSYKSRINLGANLELDLTRVQLLNEMGRNSMLEYVRKGPAKALNLSETWGEELSKLINKTLPQATPAELLNGIAPSKALPSPQESWRHLLDVYARENLMDFDIIMVLFEYLLRSDPAFWIHARGAFTHIIADEFQDTNLPQLLALKRLAGYADAGQTKARMVVVGDDFQTIYRWRGAVPNIFSDYEKWDTCATLGLRTNWRSAQEPLGVVNAAARRLALHPDHAALVSSVPAELKLGRTDLCGGAESQLSVSDAIRRLCAANLPFASITVLAYTNDTTLKVVRDLKQAGIPCELCTARPCDEPGVRRFLALLSAWASQGEREFANWWFLADTFGGFGADEFDAIWQTTAAQTPDENLQTVESLLGSLAPSFNEACVAEDVKQATPDSVERVAHRFLSDAVIKAEQTTCLRLARLLGGHPDFRHEPGRLMGEMTRKDFAATDAKTDAVQISTVHQYKGLENQGIVLVYDFDPLENGDTLRLDYVARSRAARWLIAVNAPAQVCGDGY